MEETESLTFILKAKVLGVEITPKTIGLSMFNRFNKEVEMFLAGSRDKVPIENIHVEIKEGSYVIKTLLPALVAALLKPDLARLHREDALDEIDSRRAEIVTNWQKRARDVENYSVAIQISDAVFEPILITKETDYHNRDQDEWVAVEKYVIGQVVDLGGVTKANVHIALEDSGKTLIAMSSEDYLRDQKQNFVYRRVQLHVAGMENLRTGELKDIRLIAFVGEGPSYDEKELDAAIEKGTRAWADVTDSVAWVREQRGKYE